MADLSSRVEALRSNIAKLMRIGGTTGISLGIIHQGEPVYSASYGFREVQRGNRPSDQTIYPVASLTMAVTAAALGILVDEKKADWDTLVKDALPLLDINDDILQNHMTLSDLLCHRSGMSRADNLVIGSENNILISEQDSMAFLNSQTRVLPFRAQFAFNSLAYALAGKVIESLSGQSYSDFVQSRILDPLGMTRTYLKTPPPDLDHVSKAYNALDFGDTRPIACVKTGDDRVGAPDAGMRSCVSDLIKLYKAFLTCYNDQIESGRTSTDNLPLKQVSQLMSAKTYLGQPSRNEVSYGFGWARVQLPGSLGQLGINPALMPDGMPIVGKGVAPRLAIYHQGRLPGAMSLALLLPDTESAIIICTNTLAFNDVPDWVAQFVLEELLEVPESQRNDYIDIAFKSTVENRKWYADLVKELARAQESGTRPKELGSYVGTYWDRLRIFKIVVTLESGSLCWAFQGLESEKFRLSHYENDTFTWLQTREELAERGRWVRTSQGPSFWKVEFKIGEAGRPDRLYWAHDNDAPAGEYTKE